MIIHKERGWVEISTLKTGNVFEHPNGLHILIERHSDWSTDRVYAVFLSDGRLNSFKPTELVGYHPKAFVTIPA